MQQQRWLMAMPQLGLAQYLHSCVQSGAHQWRLATLLTTAGHHNMPTPKNKLAQSALTQELVGGLS